MAIPRPSHLLSVTQYRATITTAVTDSAGNALASNFTLQFTTVPATPVGTAILTWDAVTAGNPSGYRLYYGTSPGTYFQTFGNGVPVGNVVTHTLNGLSSGTRYYFAVTAVDTSNNESNYSNEVFKDVP